MSRDNGSPLSRIGLSLWTMQSTARAPRHAGLAYQRLARDARLVEAYGFHSLWSSEHRGWYDGWCPAPMHALPHAAAGTQRLRFGTAMLLLPQHGAQEVRDAADTFDRFFPGRLELGVGLGYRDPEFDALGLDRSERGSRMEVALTRLMSEPAAYQVWVGGMADASLARARRHGCGILLPQTVSMPRLRTVIQRHREANAGPIALTQDVHVCADPARFHRDLRAHFREEITSWWPLRADTTQQRDQRVGRQLDRIAGSAIAGPPAEVAERIDALFGLGVDLLVLRLCFDFLRSAQLHEQIGLLAEETVPLLSKGRVDS